MPQITINIFFLKINAIETASSLNIGQALLADYQVSTKSNAGHGSNFGDGSGFMATQSAVDDKDLMDSNHLLGRDHDLLKGGLLK